MRIGLYPFSASAEIDANFLTIRKAVSLAAAQGVRLLAFQECALCGYPPVETPEIDRIGYLRMERYANQVGELAGSHGLYIALGRIRQEAGRRYNSIQLFSPDGNCLGFYDKRALWGWDAEHFTPGIHPGVFWVDGIPVGFRICFEVRFPEYFRELFVRQVPLCIVSFCDVAVSAKGRYEMIKSHLVTRASENVVTLLSVNSTSGDQTAPTAVFGPGGQVLAEAGRGLEQLLVYDYQQQPPDFSEQGRIALSKSLNQL